MPNDNMSVEQLVSLTVAGKLPYNVDTAREIIEAATADKRVTTHEYDAIDRLVKSDLGESEYAKKIVAVFRNWVASRVNYGVGWLTDYTTPACTYVKGSSADLQTAVHEARHLVASNDRLIELAQRYGVPINERVTNTGTRELTVPDDVYTAHASALAREDFDEQDPFKHTRAYLEAQYG